MACWCGYLPGARCRRAYIPADATASCFSKIQIGFTFLVPAHSGSPGQSAVKRVYVSSRLVIGIKFSGRPSVCVWVHMYMRLCVWASVHTFSYCKPLLGSVCCGSVLSAYLVVSCSMGAVVVICLQLGADLHTAKLMPLPLTVSCFI